MPTQSPESEIAPVPEQGQLVVVRQRTYTVTDISQSSIATSVTSSARPTGWTVLTDLSEGCPTWSRNDEYLYFQTFDVSTPEFARARISDGNREHLAGIDFRRGGQRDWYWWNGLTPDGSPVVLRDESTEEIFALDWKLP